MPFRPRGEPLKIVRRAGGVVRRRPWVGAGYWASSFFPFLAVIEAGDQLHRLVGQQAELQGAFQVQGGAAEQVGDDAQVVIAGIGFALQQQAQPGVAAVTLAVVSLVVIDYEIGVEQRDGFVHQLFQGGAGVAHQQRRGP